MSGPLKRDAYVKLPNVVEKDNVAWKPLKLLYGLSTAGKDWCETMRDFLENERGGEVTTVDKSVFFWTQQGFGYGYEKKLRDSNSPNIDNGILRWMEISRLPNKEIR